MYSGLRPVGIMFRARGCQIWTNKWAQELRATDILSQIFICLQSLDIIKKLGYSDQKSCNLGMEVVVAYFNVLAQHRTEDSK